MERFAENLRAIMAKRGITQAALSEATGISRPNISRILNGHEGVTLDRAEVIADAVGVSLSRLVSQPRAAKA